MVKKSACSDRSIGRNRTSYTTRGPTFQVVEDIIPIAELKAHLSETVRGLEERGRR